MTQLQGPSVSLKIASPRAIAAVRAQLPIRRVPAMFAEYLNQVYAAARDGTIQLDGQNIFVYRDVIGAKDEADIEFGVGVNAPFSPNGAVRYSELPVGEVATATHWGDYARLGQAHHAGSRGAKRTIENLSDRGGKCTDTGRTIQLNCGPTFTIFCNRRDEKQRRICCR